MASQPTPPQTYPPPEIRPFLRAYENPVVSLNKALLNPYFSGGGTLGGG